MEIVPFSNMGPAFLGARRDEVKQAMSAHAYPLRTVTKGEKEIDACAVPGHVLECVFLHYDQHQRVEFIEAALPAAPEFWGITFLGRKAENVVADLNALGFENDWIDDARCDFAEIGLSLYAPLEPVEAVSIWHEGYDEQPNHEP